MKHSIIFILPVLALIAAACGGASAAPTQSPAPAATTAPTTAPTEAPTNTLEPTPDLTATAQAEATAQTAARLETIRPDLELAGFTLDSGQLVYAQAEPIEIKVDSTTPSGYLSVPLADPNPVFVNFVIGVDILWDSKYGGAGCTISFRSEEDLRMGLRADFNIVRQSGRPIWDIQMWKFNQDAGNATGGNRYSATLDQDPGSTNHIVLVADGLTTTVFINGQREGSGTLKASMDKGVIGYQAWQSSGTTTCTFSNAWVWELP